jgi:hypothetical protein
VVFENFLKGHVSKKSRTHLLKLEMLGVMGLVLVHCVLYYKYYCI